MDEKIIKRRNVIKNVIIIFLVILLVLTLASNTIMNSSLPEVAVTYPKYGTISKRIRGEATVIANQSYVVTFDETRTIAKVLVREGDVVNKGDVIYELEPGENEVLTNARKALNDARKAYLRKQQEQYTGASDALKSLEADRDAKKAELDAAKAMLRNYAIADTALEIAVSEEASAQKRVDDLQREIDKLTSQLEGVNSMEGDVPSSESELKALLSKAESDLSSAKAQLLSAREEKDSLVAQKKSLEAQIESIDRQIEYLNSMKGSYGSVDYAAYIAAYEELRNSKTELEKTEAQHAALSEYLTKYAEYLASVGTDNEAAAKEAAAAAAAACESAGVVSLSDVELSYLSQKVTALTQKVAVAQKNYDDIYAQYSQSSGDQAAVESVNSQISSLETQKKYVEFYLEQASAGITENDAEISRLEGLVSDLETKISLYSGNLNYDSVYAQRAAKYAEKDAADALLASAKEKVASYRELSGMTEAEINVKIDTLTDELAILNKQISDRKKSDSIDEDIYEIELQEYKDSYEEAEALVKKLEEKATSGVVTAPVSGTVEDLLYVAGEKINANDTVATIVITDKGYTMTYTVSNEQAATISVGAEVTITNYWWGTTPSARVVSIKNAPSDPGKSKVITIELTGEVTPGQRFSFTIGDKGRDYDKIIPSSAIREDSNGKYVLIVSAKSTPLGNRYTAQRVDVTVLASDETMSAVEGEFSGEYVITTSSTPISAGMQVRLSE